jgi:hypothetical protein
MVPVLLAGNTITLSPRGAPGFYITSHNHTHQETQQSMDTGSGKKIGLIVLAILCSYVIAQYLSVAGARMLGLHGAEMYFVSFVLYAVIFLLVLTGLQRAFGVFILDSDRLE